MSVHARGGFRQPVRTLPRDPGCLGRTFGIGVRPEALSTGRQHRLHDSRVEGGGMFIAGGSRELLGIGGGLEGRGGEGGLATTA